MYPNYLHEMYMFPSHFNHIIVVGLNVIELKKKKAKTMVERWQWQTSMKEILSFPTL